MSKKTYKVKISKKNISGKNKIIPAFETSSIVQQDILINKKSNLAVPNMTNVIDAKKFSEEHQQ